MRTKSILIASILSIAIVVGCSSSDENGTDNLQNITQSQDSLNKAKEEFLLDVEEYRLEMAKLIAANDSISNAFRAKLISQSKSNNPYYEPKIAALEKQNRDMEKKIDDYEEDESNWESFKTEFKHDMGELGQSFKDLGVKNTK